MMMMVNRTRPADERRKKRRLFLPFLSLPRSSDELISNSYFSSSFFFFFSSVSPDGSDFVEERRRTRKRREKKIVHPIGDARGCSEFCRLACSSLQHASGHDWSKTANERRNDESTIDCLTDQIHSERREKKKH